MRLRLALVVLLAFAPSAHAAWSQPYRIADGAAAASPVIGPDGTWAWVGAVPGGARQVGVLLRRGSQTRVARLRLHREDVGTADVALDRRGRATVVWSQGHRVASALCTLAGCGAAHVVGKVGHAHATPRVVVEPRERALVFWRGVAHGAAPRLQWAFLAEGRRAGRVHTLGAFGTETQLAIDDAGRETAAWTSSLGFVCVATRVRGEFGRLKILMSGPNSYLQMRVAPSGQAVLAWRHAYGDSEGEHPTGEIYMSMRPADGTFTRPQLVSAHAAAGVADAAAIAPDGRAVIAWEEAHAPPSLVEEPFDLRATFVSPGGAIGPPVVLSRSAAGLGTAITDAGRAAVAWDEGDYAHGYSLRAAVSEPGASTFGSPTAFATAGDGRFAMTAVKDQLVVTWITASETDASVYSPQ
jgi:hypothetical protein